MTSPKAIEMIADLMDVVAEAKSRASVEPFPVAIAGTADALDALARHPSWPDLPPITQYTLRHPGRLGIPENHLSPLLTLAHLLAAIAIDGGGEEMEGLGFNDQAAIVLISGRIIKRSPLGFDPADLESSTLPGAVRAEWITGNPRRRHAAHDAAAVTRYCELNGYTDPHKPVGLHDWWAFPRGAVMAVPLHRSQYLGGAGAALDSIYDRYLEQRRLSIERIGLRERAYPPAGAAERHNPFWFASTSAPSGAVPSWFDEVTGELRGISGAEIPAKRTLTFERLAKKAKIPDHALAEIAAFHRTYFVGPEFIEERSQYPSSAAPRNRLSLPEEESDG